MWRQLGFHRNKVRFGLAPKVRCEDVVRDERFHVFSWGRADCSSPCKACLGLSWRQRGPIFLNRSVVGNAPPKTCSRRAELALLLPDAAVFTHQIDMDELSCRTSTAI